MSSKTKAIFLKKISLSLHSFVLTTCLPLVLLVLTVSGFAQTSRLQAPGRNPHPIDESAVVTLMGNTHPWALPEFDRGTVPAEMRLNRMVLVLRSGEQQKRALDMLVEKQHEPGTLEYHQWLTPEQFGQRFGLSAADETLVVGWLRSHGFAVEPLPAGRRTVVFSGTAAQVEEAFHTEIHRFEVAGVGHIANTQDPQVPTALSAVVAGILSLHDFRRQSEIAGIHPAESETGRRGASPENTQSGGVHYLFPADFATIYDVNPVYAAGTTGKGSTIAIVGRSNINLSDVQTFRSFTGLSAATQPSVIFDGANPGLIPGDQDEATLDVEWSGAVAPAAQVKLVVAASTATTDGVDLSAQYIVNQKTAPIMSTSFGNCEANMGAAEVAFYNSLWQQAASEGISAFVSSGDSGAAGCNGGSSSKGTVAGVNGLCSSPFSTCVGGTEFNEGAGKYWAATNGAGGGSALGYIPEKVWNESGTNLGLWASGGGVSQVYTQPVWQQEISGANSNGMRAVPDVALTSASHDGYLVCENGNFYIFGGTSASSPSFAGLMALVVQAKGGVGEGNANPGLYSLPLAATNPFHSTPTGNNSVPGVTGFTASGGPYNLATGLGSVDARLLVSEWGTVSPSGATPGFTLTPSLKTVTIAAGKSAQLALSITGTGGFARTVALTSTLPAGVTLSFNPASAKPGQAVTVTVSIAATFKPGTGVIKITGTSSPLVTSVSIPLTVVAPPTLALTATPVSAVVSQGKTVALTVTAVTGGSFSGSIALSASGLPAGVTGVWSSNNVSVGAATTRATLTLSATSTAALSTGKLTLTAAGDGLTAQATGSVQVVH